MWAWGCGLVIPAETNFFFLISLAHCISFYCCVTNDHKLSGIKTTHLSPHNFCELVVWVQPSVLYSGSQKVVIKLLVRLHSRMET